MLEKFNIKVLIIFTLLIFGTLGMPRYVQNADSVPNYNSKYNVAKVDPKQLHCMAKNIFYEASGESIKGQAAVARVVLNRVAHGFAKTPCGVIYQATVVDDVKICQFSWVCEDKGEPNKNSYRYKVAQQIAYDVMAHDMYHDVIPKSVLFFHNITVNPLWPYAEAMRIGNHIFYSKFKKKNIRPKEKNIKEEEI